MGNYNPYDNVLAVVENAAKVLGYEKADYEALKYFTEFWCSDNTDPVTRAYIQWGFSQIFPAKAMAAHVTSWNKNT